MARPKPPSRITARGGSSGVSLKQRAEAFALSTPASVQRSGMRLPAESDRRQIAKTWQVEAYRHVNICGEARYAATLFASMAGRAEIGVSEPQALQRKAVWVESGPEVDALNELVPTVRERSKLIRDYMLHLVIAGECYLIARPRQANDPVGLTDEVWEIVGVTDIQRTAGDVWQVRYDNNSYIDLPADAPVIRLWNPDPSNRREAWSPFRSLLPTLREIEFLTRHIFTQVQSRLVSAGVWFLPNNLTFAPPPVDAVEGGAEALGRMNEAELLMVSLASTGMEMLDDDEVAFPSVVMADPDALASIDQSKLIQFWSEIDDAAMVLRSDAVRRFALGMDLPPEQVLGSSGLAVTGAGGSAGSVNHWGVWANEEQTISAHIEPALDLFVGTLTVAYLRNAVEGTDKVVGYDTASLRLRQDRSKEALEWYDRGVLKADVALRENGFDPSSDQMDDAEHARWLLNRLAGGSATPEQVHAALQKLGVDLPVVGEGEASGISDRNGPRSLDDHPYEGPPRVQHDQTEAPFGAEEAAMEALVLRALEKAGNVVLNSGKRGRERDRETPAHLAHVTMSVSETPAFDFSLLPATFADRSQVWCRSKALLLEAFCADLYASKRPYSREGLIKTLRGL